MNLQTVFEACKRIVEGRIVQYMDISSGKMVQNE